jgi:hypothetical protein
VVRIPPPAAAGPTFFTAVVHDRLIVEDGVRRIRDRQLDLDSPPH